MRKNPALWDGFDVRPHGRRLFCLVMLAKSVPRSTIYSFQLIIPPDTGRQIQAPTYAIMSYMPSMTQLFFGAAPRVDARKSPVMKSPVICACPSWTPRNMSHKPDHLNVPRRRTGGIWILLDSGVRQPGWRDMTLLTDHKSAYPSITPVRLGLG